MPIPDLTRAASEPPLSAVSAVPLLVQEELSADRATDAWVHEQSIISQEETMLLGAKIAPATRRLSSPPILRYDCAHHLVPFLLTVYETCRNPRVEANSRPESTWSIISSPKNITRSPQLGPHASPPCAPVELPQSAHVISTHATGGTFASESSSGAATPLSSHSLLHALSEQIAAQRAHAEPGPSTQRKDLVLSRGTSPMSETTNSSELDAPIDRRAHV